ncbi:MAG: SusF/SusE family outer membrane protein [Prevotella veroralis]
MKSIVKYGMALLALLAPITFQSCHDDKDIVVITEDLPLKVDHLYMVGDATPAGWSIDNPYEMTRDEHNKYLFTYHGKLKTGEIKLPLSKGDWGATFVYAPAADTEINDKGVASDAIDIRKGGADNKWKVTKTGIYTFAVDLRTRKLSVTYEGEEPAGPTPWDTETVYMIGSATPAGWVTDNGVAFTKSGDHIFSVEVQLAEGEMKFMLDKTGFSDEKPYFFAPAADTEVNDRGVANDALVYGTEKSYGDKKWKVTKAGKYKLTLDLKNKKFKAEYLGA